MGPVANHERENPMKHLLIFAALTAGAANADPSPLSAAGQSVTNAYGDVWRFAHAETAALKKIAATPASLTAEVRFDFDASELRDADRKALDELVEQIHARQVRNVVATAHADRLGGELYNLGLSARRAHAVRDYLVERGIPESVIQVDVAGAATPQSACDGLGDESRRNLKLVACLQPDRRVEVEAAAK
jgi:outer membrane protein OmpA-like peptidoglycan-associated protein